MAFDPTKPVNGVLIDADFLRGQFNGLNDLITAVPAGPAGADGAPGANGADGHSIAMHTVSTDKLTADHTGWTNGDEVVVMHPRVATLVMSYGGGGETLYLILFTDENGASGSITANSADSAESLAAAIAAAIAANCNCTTAVEGATVTITSKTPGVLLSAWAVTSDLPTATLTVTQEGEATESLLVVDDTQLGAEAGYADLQGADGLDGAAGANGAPGEVSSADLAAAIAGSSSNSNAVATLDTPFSNDPPTLVDIETLRGKLNELITALRR